MRSMDLKPCPFCGSNDLDGPNLTEYIGDHREPFWWIDCNNCPCGMEVDGEFPMPVIKAWNNRHNKNECIFCDPDFKPDTGEDLIVIAEGE